MFNMQGQRHFMVDTETTGLVPGVHGVTSVGIVAFDIVSRFWCDTVGTLHIAVDTGTRFDSDPDTMDFRRRHNIDSIEASLPKYGIRAAETAADRINEFINTVGEGREKFMWSKPLNFDLAHLVALFYECDVEPCWNYRNVMDMRSFIVGMGIPHYEVIAREKQIAFEGTPHHALDDSKHQVKVLDYFLVNHTVRDSDVATHATEHAGQD